MDKIAFLVPETQQLINSEHVVSLFFPVKYLTKKAYPGL